MNDSSPIASYNFRKNQEIRKGKKMGTSVNRTTNSRKVPYTTEYELRRDIKEKQVIDEINRQNLYSDYGV